MAAIVGSVFFVVNFAVAVFGAPKKTATNLPVFTLVWVVCVLESAGTIQQRRPNRRPLSVEIGFPDWKRYALAPSPQPNSVGFIPSQCRLSGVQICRLHAFSSSANHCTHTHWLGVTGGSVCYCCCPCCILSFVRLLGDTIRLSEEGKETNEHGKHK